MKRLVMIGLLSLLLGTLCVTSVGASEPQLDGHWEGAIVQPSGELKIAVDFTTEGATKGTSVYPLPQPSTGR